jgi:two-component system, NarL family, sensor kinase
MEMETAIFRVIQECLTNIHRHSRSRTAPVEVSRSSQAITVQVADKGVGLVVKKTLGVGLRGMRERVGQFGGKFELSSDASGTTVTASFPWNDRATKS